MKGLIVTALVGGAALASCTSTVSGQASAVGGGLSSATSAGSGPSSPIHRTDLCSLIGWSDLGYPGTTGAQSPTETGTVPGSQASCSWKSQQFYAGYTPPPEPSCNNDNSGNVAGHLSCMDADVLRFTAIENNSTWVAVAIAYLAGQPLRTSSSYVDDGHTVYLKQNGYTCVAETEWDHATLAVADTDNSKAFGPPCDEVKKVMAKLIQEEPHG